MARGDDGAGGKRRELLVRPPEVAVGEEEPDAVGHDGRVGPEHREREHVLVDLGVAVAADGHDALGHRVERLRGGLRVVVRRDAVARPVVERVAEEADEVRRVRLDAGAQRLHRGGYAVRIGEEENAAHGFATGMSCSGMS